MVMQSFLIIFYWRLWLCSPFLIIFCWRYKIPKGVFLKKLKFPFMNLCIWETPRILNLNDWTLIAWHQTRPTYFFPAFSYSWFCLFFRLFFSMFTHCIIPWLSKYVFLHRQGWNVYSLPIDKVEMCAAMSTC